MINKLICTIECWLGFHDEHQYMHEPRSGVLQLDTECHRPNCSYHRRIGWDTTTNEPLYDVVLDRKEVMAAKIESWGPGGCGL